MEIEPACISKYNYKRKKQIILLMISDDGNRWHYLAVKSLPALLRGITSNHHGDFVTHTQHIINFKNMKEYVRIMISVV